MQIKICNEDILNRLHEDIKVNNMRILKYTRILIYMRIRGYQYTIKNENVLHSSTAVLVQIITVSTKFTIVYRYSL